MPDLINLLLLQSHSSLWSLVQLNLLHQSLLLLFCFFFEFHEVVWHVTSLDHCSLSLQVLFYLLLQSLSLEFLIDNSNVSHITLYVILWILFEALLCLDILLALMLVGHCVLELLRFYLWVDAGEFVHLEQWLYRETYEIK